MICEDCNKVKASTKEATNFSIYCQCEGTIPITAKEDDGLAEIENLLTKLRAKYEKSKKETDELRIGVESVELTLQVMRRKQQVDAVVGMEGD